MDTTQEHVDPEPMAQRINNKKRRIEGTTEGSDEIQEMDDVKTQKPGKGNNREGVKNLRSEEGSEVYGQVLHHDPQEGNGPTTLHEETIDQLKMLHTRQLEEQKKYKEGMDNLKKEMEEKSKGEMETLGR